jgi:glycosyltransferase involved in cell wall biosynthesis
MQLKSRSRRAPRLAGNFVRADITLLIGEADMEMMIEAPLVQKSLEFAGVSAPPPPLRVIHVTSAVVRGGIEYWFKGLIRFADPRRLQFVRCVATATDPALYDPGMAADFGVPVVQGQADAVRQAALECDVLLCSGPENIASWLGDLRPKLCVFVAHGESHWTRDILEGCAPVADHVIAVSNRVREQVCQGFPSSVILNGVDAARVAQTRSPSLVRQQLGFAAGDFVVGYVGRFSPEKRPERLIEAVALAPPHVKALLVGWGPLREQLLNLANALIPGRYAFVTASDHLGDYLHALDAFCLSSSCEGFALVALEAMLCGRPLIATPVGCVPEIIQDRVNGLIVSGTAASITDSIRLLDDHPNWAAGLGAQGQAYAQQHGHALRMAGEYEALLERLWRERYPAEDLAPLQRAAGLWNDPGTDPDYDA